MIKTTVLAAALALAVPFAAQAETEKYSSYQASCDAETCNNFQVSYEETGEKVAQTRRTRTRRTRSTNRLFKDYYVGGGAGIFFGDGLDLGFQGHVFGGTKYNEYIGADVEFTFGTAGIDNFDENVSYLGIWLNPRFEYKFENSNITAFASPGLGILRASIDGNSDSDLEFQIKAGAEFPFSDNFDAYAQGRMISDGDIFGVEVGAIFDISK